MRTDLYRRSLLKAIFSSLSLLVLEGPLSLIRGEVRRGIGETFSGERLHYRIGFWWFKDAAKGSIAFEGEGRGRYVATVRAETLGIIGWLTRYRKDIYHAYMEEIDGGRRLRTYLFEKEVNIGGRIRKGYIRADYNSGVVEWKSWGSGPERGGKDPIPEGRILDDPIGAFYNFRYGAYGPVEEGRSYRIDTFPKDGRIQTIQIRIATEEEKMRRLRSMGHKVAYLVDLRVDKDIIGSKAGKIEVMLDRDLVPVMGVVRDVFFFGDVKGRLVRR